jgi:hypothetical protein
MAKKNGDLAASVAAHEKLFSREEPAEEVTPTPSKRGRPSGSVTRGTVTFAGKKIFLLVKENPKQPGTAAHEKWKLYRNGMTVEEYYAAGGRTSSLKWDSEREFIKVK